jgi:hypothetical protein
MVYFIVMMTLIKSLSPVLNFSVMGMGNLLYFVGILMGVLFLGVRFVQKGDYIRHRLFWHFNAFIFVCAFLSLFFSFYPIYSLLKMGLFYLVAVVLFGGFYFSKNDEWERFFVTLGVWLALISTPFLFILGNHRNGRFQGIFFQSQTIGVIAAPLYLWVFNILFRHWKSFCFSHKVIALGLMCTMTVQVYLSGCRTAGVAMIVVPVVGYFFREKGAVLNLIKSRSFWVGSGVFSGVCLGLWRYVKAFFVKDFQVGLALSMDYVILTQYRLQAVYDSPWLILYSRLQFVVLSYYNIKDHFFTGIGWDTPSINIGEPIRGAMGVITEIPALEKGIVWVALLEENGVFGFGLFIVFLWSIFRRIRVLKTSIYLQLFLLIILLNFGEATLFSANGLGAYQLVLLLVGVYVVDQKRLKSI